MGSKKPRVFEPLITSIQHQPTYYVHSMVRHDGTPLSHGHTPPTFRKKRDLQSTKSQKRTRNAINWMLLFADKKVVYSKQPYINKKGEEQHYFNYRLGFITLTLSALQAHPDDYIKEHMLQPFLYWLTRYHNSSYVWKCEAQLNGNIHFHIVIDTFIHWRSVRAKWNSIQAKHGYCKVYQDGSNDKGNAATQVKAIRNEQQCSKYIASYMAKKNEFQIEKYDKPFKELPKLSYPDGSITLMKPTERKHYLRFTGGRQWSCSENLSSIRIYTNEVDDFLETTMTEFDKHNNPKNLGEMLITEAIQKSYSMSPELRSMMKMEELDILHRYEHLRRVYVHRNLKYCKLPSSISDKLANIKNTRKFPTQKFFTV